jgi:2-oxoisovalerate dehydrogenase E2 component (dihydrolipoyl transacylase)
VLHEFRMPDPGEGLTEAEVLDWRVAVGDAIVVNQILLEVETAKAAVELPSPYAGVVVDLLVAAGDVVPVGQPIIRIEDGVQAPSDTGDGPTQRATAGGSGAGGSAAGAPAPAAAPVEPVPPAATSHAASQGAGGDDETTAAASGTQAGRQSVLVGYGVKAAQTPLRRPRRTPHGVDHVEPGPPGEPGRPVRQGGLELGRALESRLGSDQVRAKPPVRRLARDLDVDLTEVLPTGPGGSITHDDVARAAAAVHGAAPTRIAPNLPAVRAAEGGGSEVVPLTHVGRVMAQAMTSSAFTAVHVTEWVDVDVSAMTSLIRAARSREDMAGLSITPLTFAALGLVRSARDHPTVNASLDEDGENLLVHRNVHLGIAVDSPRGLIVPRIPDAGDLDLRGMADALARLIETARAGRSRPEDLRGSTITITNVGVFGVDGGTPILNPGEVAILALGRVLPRPWVVEGRIEVRDVVTLALSFDHRVVDGAMGSRVLREVADFMADPATGLALG